MLHPNARSAPTHPPAHLSGSSTDQRIAHDTGPSGETFWRYSVPGSGVHGSANMLPFQ
jgi:hypothetical protein